MLFEYLQQTQRLIGDANQKKFAPNDLTYYINTARRHIAELTQSVRILTPISGSITSISVTAGGSAYTSPTITISAPDLPGGTAVNPGGLQATATGSLTAAVLTSISVTQAGSGYYAPVVTITDPTGSGASATAITSTVTTLVANQEVYNFSDMPLGGAPGVDSIFAVRSIAIIYSGYRYALPVYSFSTYQAYIRQYPLQYRYVPAVAAQYGQGADGSLYFYPTPSQAYSFQVDAYCLPINLIDDTTAEALPQPWRDSVSYYAAYLAKLEAQDMNGARMLLDLFDKMLQRQSNSARIGRRTNPYGRWAILLPLISSLLSLGQIGAV